MPSIIDQYLSGQVDPVDFSPFNASDLSFVPSDDPEKDRRFLAAVESGRRSRFFVTLISSPRRPDTAAITLVDAYNFNLLWSGPPGAPMVAGPRSPYEKRAAVVWFSDLDDQWRWAIWRAWWWAAALAVDFDPSYYDPVSVRSPRPDYVEGLVDLVALDLREAGQIANAAGWSPPEGRKLSACPGPYAAGWRRGATFRLRADLVSSYDGGAFSFLRGPSSSFVAA